MQRIFLSYRYDDSDAEDLAELVAAMIESQDMLCVRGKELALGQPLSTEVIKKLDSCDGAIFLMTPDSENRVSDWVEKELNYSFENSKAVACLIASAVEIPPLTNQFVTIRYGDGRQSLAKALSQLLRTLGSWRREVAPEQSLSGMPGRPAGEIRKVAQGKVFLRWETLGSGIRHLSTEVNKNKPRIDAIIGVNEVGLSCASYLSTSFPGKPIGYAMHHRQQVGGGIGIRDFFYPEMDSPAKLLVLDSELKSGGSLETVVNHIRSRTGVEAVLFLAVVAAQTSGGKLSAEQTLQSLNVKDVYVAYTFEEGVRFAHRCLNHFLIVPGTVFEYEKQ